MKRSILRIEMGNVIVKAVLQGYWYNESLSYSPKHNHAAFEFHVIGKGLVLLKTDSGTFKLNEKDSVLICPETFHMLRNQVEGSIVLNFLFFIEKNKKKNVVDYYNLIEQNRNRNNGIVIFPQNAQIDEYAKKIIANLYSDNLLAEECVKSWFTLLLAEIFSVLNENKKSAYNNSSQLAESDMRFFMIEDYFNEHYMEDVNLKDLANRLYLSEKQTDRMIKKAFGEGFSQHLCKIRILIAKDLLTDTDKDVSEIALEVGYKSYNGFYLAFKQYVKMTPNQYRTKYKNEK